MLNIPKSSCARLAHKGSKLSLFFIVKSFRSTILSKRESNSRAIPSCVLKLNPLPDTPPAARRAPLSPPKYPLTKERENVTDYEDTELRNEVQQPDEKLNAVAAALAAMKEDIKFP